MWQVEEDKGRGGGGEGERMRVHRRTIESSYDYGTAKGTYGDGTTTWGCSPGNGTTRGLPVGVSTTRGAKEECPSGEKLAVAGTRHILVVRAELGALEKGIERMMGSSIKVGWCKHREKQAVSAPQSATAADPAAAATVIRRDCRSAGVDASADAAAGAPAGAQMSHHLNSSELPPHESPPVALIRKAVEVVMGLHPSVRAVALSKGREGARGTKGEVRAEATEESEEAEGQDGKEGEEGEETAGTYLVVFASAEMAGAAEWRIREASRRAKKSEERRSSQACRSGSDSNSSSRKGVPDESLGERLEGCADGCLEKELDRDVDERLVRTVACCLSVTCFEDVSADVLVSCYWSVLEWRKTRVDGAAAARLLSRSLV